MMTSSVELRDKWRRFDWVLGIPTALLLGLGPLLIFACGESYEGLVPRQLLWIAVGFVASLPVMLIPYGRWLGFAPLGYAIGIASLFAVRLFAPEVNGSKRWFLIGGVQIQPSEFMKLAVVLTIAWILRFGKPIEERFALWKILALCALPSLLVVVQPDLGTSLLFLPIGLFVLFSAGLPLRRCLALLVALLCLGALAFRFGLEEYQQERIASTYRWESLTPAQRWNTAYQLTQSYARIASGGFLGASEEELPPGLEGGLPHRHNDFIFAVLAQRGGFLGAIALVLVHFALVAAILGVAARTRDAAGRTICVGVAGWFFAQGSIHVAVTTGIAPTTGMTFPLVSYGGSSTLVACLALATVQNVAMHPVRLLSSTRRFRTTGRSRSGL